MKKICKNCKQYKSKNYVVFAFNARSRDGECRVFGGSADSQDAGCYCFEEKK